MLIVGCHPLAKLEANLRCLMTTRLGDNIDHTVSSSEHVQRVGSKVQKGAAKYWTTGHEVSIKAVNRL